MILCLIPFIFVSVLNVDAQSERIKQRRYYDDNMMLNPFKPTKPLGMQASIFGACPKPG